MKYFILSAFLVGLTQLGFSQDEEPGFSTKIDKDNGLAPFAIDVPKEKLAPYLISDPSVVADEFCTSAYKVDFKRAGLTQFFGLAITDMQVSFDGETDTEGQPLSEDVWSISATLSLPKTDAEVQPFMEALNSHFGQGEYMWDPDFTKVVRMFWWSEISMLYVHLGVNVETGETLNFYSITLSQAYGG